MESLRESAEQCVEVEMHHSSSDLLLTLPRTSPCAAWFSDDTRAHSGTGTGTGTSTGNGTAGPLLQLQALSRARSGGIPTSSSAIARRPQCCQALRAWFTPETSLTAEDASTVPTTAALAFQREKKVDMVKALGMETKENPSMGRVSFESCFAPLGEASFAVPQLSSADRPLSHCAVSLDFLLAFVAQLQSGQQEWSTLRVVQDIIIPATQSRACRYVDLLQSEHVSHPTFFVSHCWAASFTALVYRLLDIMTEQKDVRKIEAMQLHGPRNIYFWLDIFAVNQHGGSVQSTDLQHLTDAIQQSTMGTLLVLDDSMSVFNRIWCLFEMHKTVELRSQDHLRIFVPHGHSKLLQVWEVVDVLNAHATVASDKEQILADIARSDIPDHELNMSIRRSITAALKDAVDTSRIQADIAKEVFQSADDAHRLITTLLQFVSIILDYLTLLARAGDLETGPDLINEAIRATARADELSVSADSKGQALHPQVVSALARCALVAATMRQQSREYDHQMRSAQRAMQLSSHTSFLTGIIQTERGEGSYPPTGLPSEPFPSYWDRLEYINAFCDSFVSARMYNGAIRHVESSIDYLEQMLPRVWPPSAALSPRGLRVRSHAHPVHVYARRYTGLFSCDVCRQQGCEGAAWSCHECQWDAHPQCAWNDRVDTSESGSEGGEHAPLMTEEEWRELTDKAMEQSTSGLLTAPVHAGLPPLPVFVSQLVHCYCVQAGIKLAFGQDEQAVPMLRQAIHLFQTVHGQGWDTHPQLARPFKLMGRALHDKGEHEEGFQYLRRSLALYLRQLGPAHPDVLEVRNLLAIQYRAQKRLDEAIEQFELILKQEKYIDSDLFYPYLAGFARTLKEGVKDDPSYHLRCIDAYERLIEDHECAFHTKMQPTQEQYQSLLQWRLEFHEVLLGRELTELVQKWMDRTIELEGTRMQPTGDDPTACLKSVCIRAKVYLKAGRYEQACALYKQADSMAEHSDWDARWSIADEGAECLTMMGHVDEAIEWRRKLSPLCDTIAGRTDVALKARCDWCWSLVGMARKGGEMHVRLQQWPAAVEAFRTSFTMMQTISSIDGAQMKWEEVDTVFTALVAALRQVRDWAALVQTCEQMEALILAPTDQGASKHAPDLESLRARDERLLRVLSERASAYAELGQLEESSALRQRAVEQVFDKWRMEDAHQSGSLSCSALRSRYIHWLKLSIVEAHTREWWELEYRLTLRLIEAIFTFHRGDTQCDCEPQGNHTDDAAPVQVQENRATTDPIDVSSNGSSVSPISAAAADPTLNDGAQSSVTAGADLLSLPGLSRFVRPLRPCDVHHRILLGNLYSNLCALLMKQPTPSEDDDAANQAADKHKQSAPNLQLALLYAAASLHYRLQEPAAVARCHQFAAEIYLAHLPPRASLAMIHIDCALSIRSTCEQTPVSAARQEQLMQLKSTAIKQLQSEGPVDPLA